MKITSSARTRRIDKRLYEAGQQCLKRLYLDHRSPADEAQTDARRAMSETGAQLLQLARSAFPNGKEIVGKTLEQAAAQTAELLAQDTTAVLFGAAFVAGKSEVATDILVRQKDGRLDLYEIKSGTRVKARYLTDLAFQALTIESAGFRIRAMFVLHIDKTYRHTGGSDYEAAKLIKSADVTERVRRLLPRTREEVVAYERQLDDDSVLQMPTGTFCTAPFPCPHLPNCSKNDPKYPLRLLPDLTRSLEDELHEEGIAGLDQLAEDRPGLTFRQRRTLQAVQGETSIVEPFVQEELRQVEMPLHFLAIANVTEPLPRFPEQRPWQPIPHAWFVETLHEDGRSEQASFCHADKGDPRADFVASLGKHLEVGGMILCWSADALTGLRTLLDGVPDQKSALRTILARPHLDLQRLLESGLFRPELLPCRDLAATARVLLGSTDHANLAIADQNDAFGALQKASTPRIRAATKQKIAADLQDWLEWQVKTLVRLYEHLAARPRPGVTATPAEEPSKSKRSSRATRKPLPPK